MFWSADKLPKTENFDRNNFLLVLEAGLRLITTRPRRNVYQMQRIENVVSAAGFVCNPACKTNKKLFRFKFSVFGSLSVLQNTKSRSGVTAEPAGSPQEVTKVLSA